MPPNGTGLAITNPLVLYRSLIATKRIRPDPAQHRLALHLQKLYDRLIDYEPTVEYSQRLQQLSKTVETQQKDEPASSRKIDRNVSRKGLWKSLLAQKEKRDSLALTRVLTSHEAALNLQSPKGLMLHGEVGTGKSMLTDLFYDCLPNRKKRRYHFNTFMLDTFSRLEHLRQSRSSVAQLSTFQDEYSLLWLARDLIHRSPILFLDEFQLPDRVASKILSSLMTSFFQLGGVLIATSNRMPEELAKAAGMEFNRPVSRVSRLGWTLGLGGTVGRDDGPGQLGEFAQFLEVLRVRCEVWEMEGKSDYRRVSGEEDAREVARTSASPDAVSTSTAPWTSEASLSPESTSQPTSQSISLPKYFLIHPAPSDISSLLSTALAHPGPIPWTPTTLTVYGRQIPIPRHHQGTALFTFPELCGATLGPADYITLASTYHTIILTNIPILTWLTKNEARRLITLLDALYEARCRLFVSAAASPDAIFFPDTNPSTASSATQTNNTASDPTQAAAAALYAETYSEIHQDLTSPFRPNTSSYNPSSLSEDALEDDPPNRVRRPDTPSTDDQRVRHEAGKRPRLDFGDLSALTGEDERFAVKRARSRIWEMCSGGWWGRDMEGGEGEGDDAASTSTSTSTPTRISARVSSPSATATRHPAWWRPLPSSARHWETARSPAIALPVSAYPSPIPSPSPSPSPSPQPQSEIRTLPTHPTPETLEDMFVHGASPFRTTSSPPPKIAWTHIWGTVVWGKRAGAWGRGVEGLGEREREREREGGGVGGMGDRGREVKGERER
ncbi:hypothetical protein P154DRAFT_547345 [Amniculicola lignicola CBS 123094]|uniref:AAA+ ATPase domain-containing protein n=1 Tax=Amniculicola lignicola CBS 123094 TaxID=1392246 RepID=A0A6A5W850_9PLEO|nr:hypothetical protein P154DRAFT_547345 [Amniculicola lignicola CBS 123094]